MSAVPTEERDCLVRGLRTLVLTLERASREDDDIQVEAASEIKPCMRGPGMRNAPIAPREDTSEID